MKSLLRTPIAELLALLARAIIAKYRPKIVMVTGSVGKTSTKDATAAALSARFHLRASEKSYNSEFGVPLTIIGAKNPWMSAEKWLGVISEALRLIFLPNHYPKLLVLEVGADRPGDLKRILRIATPDAVIVTLLPDVPVHVEAYASPSAVREEEFAPAYSLAPDAPLILSADDRYAGTLAARLSAKVSTYGTSPSADVRMTTPTIFTEAGSVAGMEASISYKGKRYALRTKGALGRPQMYAPAAAFTAAVALGLTPEEAIKGLEGYVPPPGRARILKGKSGSIVIDDSYNASPAAAIEALEGLSLPEAKRRVAILGDMLELGRFSLKEHRDIGMKAAEHADVVIGVGPRSGAIPEAAREKGKSERDTHYFGTAAEAAKALIDFPRAGDLILIKGSQAVRMERLVEALLEDPRDVMHLVRQEKEWKRKG